MNLPLPLDQFRFNLVLWILITTYGLSGLWDFCAFMPWCSPEDSKILWYKHSSNYAFWLISSLMFLLLWISQFQYMSLVYLSIGEIYLMILIYLYLMVQKRFYAKKNAKWTKEMTKNSSTHTKSS